MAYRNGNYSSFYVAEPFSESNLGACATEDFVYYNMLKAWKGSDPSFPFNDAHAKTYNVRDGSDWETTLKPRLHERLNKSKNIILFLSRITRNSQALREEINYGINKKGLPVIVVYTDLPCIYTQEGGAVRLSTEVVSMWDRLPVLRDNMLKVPTAHVRMCKDELIYFLGDQGFCVQSKIKPGMYVY